MGSDDGILRPDFGAPRGGESTVGYKPLADDRRRCCAHRQVLVGRNDRLVECGGCGKALDPVSILLDYANAERESAIFGRDIRRLGESIEELKKEEKRIKSRIAAAKKRASKQGILL